MQVNKDSIIVLTIRSKCHVLKPILLRHYIWGVDVYLNAYGDSGPAFLWKVHSSLFDASLQPPMFKYAGGLRAPSESSSLFVSFNGVELCCGTLVETCSVNSPCSYPGECGMPAENCSLFTNTTPTLTPTDTYRNTRLHTSVFSNRRKLKDIL